MQNRLWNYIHYHINFITYTCNFSDLKDDNEYSKLCRKLLTNHSIKINSIRQFDFYAPLFVTNIESLWGPVGV